MKSTEKAEMLKSSIAQLYTNEGRSISYISRLLEINRKTLSHKIKEWNLKEPKPQRHLTPSKQKFLNKNRNLIKSRLDNNVSMMKIADELKISRHALYKTLILNDPVLKKAHDDYIERIKNNSEERKKLKMEQSSLDYEFENLADEKWKPILSYDGYEVSNKGRIRRYVKSYDSYILIKQYPNKNNGYQYVSIVNGSKRKNLNVARLVAHTFVSGYDEKNNTVDHINGDINCNESRNLEWVSQSDNNKHAYRYLNRTKVNSKRYKFDKIVYNEKYEFKTIAAFARFIGKSETQVRHYLDEPEKYNIKLVNNCND